MSLVCCQDPKRGVARVGGSALTATQSDPERYQLTEEAKASPAADLDSMRLMISTRLGSGDIDDASQSIANEVGRTNKTKR